ncbi:MAG: hypothetical protein ACTMIR_05920 [Cellulomonadaceae bacterium]
MRRPLTVLTTITLAAALAACGGSDNDGDPTAQPTPTKGSPEPAPNEPTSDDPQSPEEPEPAPTDLPEDVLLPADRLGPPEDPREEEDGVAPWRLPDACEVVWPDADQTVTAMRTVTQGTGGAEQSIAVQQVAVFAEAGAAAQASDQLAAALQACTEVEADETRYVLEDVAVGAQGLGLAVDYYGVSATGDLDAAMGSYLVATRRGTAVTLVADEGGESLVGTARERTAERASLAWDLLCHYDSAGC